MSKRFFCIPLVIIILLLARCNRDKTAWYPEYTFPIAKGELSFNNFSNKNNTLVLDGEVVTVHYYDTLTPLNIDELVNLGDTVLQAIYSPGFAFGPIPFESGNNIFSLVEDFNFSLDGAELRTGKVKSGSLKVTFESNADGYLDLSYVIGGIRLNNNPLSILGKTEPASSENPYIDELIIDVSGYELDLTGSTGLERNTLSGDLNVSTSSLPAYTAQIYGIDEINVKMELLDLEVEELRGYFGQWEKSLDEEIILDSLIYQGGTISLAEINASLEFINNFGIDAQVQLSEIAAVNTVNSEQVLLQTGGLNDIVNISRAIETEESVIGNSVTFEFDASSNLADAISATPNRFRLVGEANLNPLGDVTGGFDFYLDRYPFQIVTEIDFPLCVGLNNLLLVDTLAVDLGSNADQIKSAKLIVTLENEFPVGFDLLVHMPEVEEALFEGELWAELNAGESEVQRIEIPVSSEQIEQLLKAKKIIISANGNTVNSEEVKILTEDKLEILITAEITYEADF